MFESWTEISFTRKTNIDEIGRKQYSWKKTLNWKLKCRNWWPNSWALLLPRPVKLLTKRVLHLLTKWVITKRVLLFAHDTSFHETYFFICSRNEFSRNECSRNKFLICWRKEIERNDFFSLLTLAHETSAHETSFEHCSRNEWSRNRCSRNEFKLVSTEQRVIC